MSSFLSAGSVRTCESAAFDGWHSLKMFVILLGKRGMFYQAVQDVWCECESACALSVPFPVIFWYMMNKEQSRTGVERDLIQKVVEVRYYVTSLGAFLRCARYSVIDRLAYSRMASGCGGGVASLHVLSGSINSWYALGISRLFRNMAVISVFALVAIELLKEIEWDTLGDQE